MTSLLIRNSICILHFIFCITAINAKCATDQIDCKNGQCINQDRLCDGNIDCENKFDEELSTCANIKCPKFSFQCSYGACIPKELKCDGTINCHDGSDEAICLSKPKASNCRNIEFECKNLQCISGDMLCDGKSDCTDGSDETLQECSRISCPPYVFRCDYGACIPEMFKCNRKIDCNDGSDEVNCGNFNLTLVTETTTISSLQNALIPTPQNINTMSEAESTPGCDIPTGDMLILSNEKDDNILIPGTRVPMETSVTYSCPKNVFLDGQFNTNFCDGLNWINPHPRCIRLCSPIRGHTINVQCTNNNVGVNCNRPVEPGTIAKISCAVLYEKPKTGVIHEDLYCRNDGQWNYSPFRCEQICGTINNQIQYSVMSTITEVHKVPWQVAIYKNDTGKYKFICGGTIIESKVVISAAHCFWNSKTVSLFDKSNYAIAVGKFYQDYYANNEPEQVQYNEISEINIPLQFRGGDYDFVSDVAVLTLTNHIEYKNHIRPACLTWRNNNEKPVPSGKLGIVAGWGVTDTGTLSPDLRSVALFSIDGQTCVQQKLTPDDRISNDKFCVETNEGQNVCQGDSGGGFIVSEDIKGTSYHYLWGIVSSGITSRNADINECNANFTTTFTNIQWYESVVKIAIANAYSGV